MFSDQAVRRAIRETFAYDSRLLAPPRVQVSRGEVTLRGMVASEEAKAAAEEDAMSVAGVARVRNLLQVRMKQPLSDEDLVERARTARALTPYVMPIKFASPSRTAQSL